MLQLRHPSTKLVNLSREKPRVEYQNHQSVPKRIFINTEPEPSHHSDLLSRTPVCQEANENESEYTQSPDTAGSHLVFVFLDRFLFRGREQVLRLPPYLQQLRRPLRDRFPYVYRYHKQACEECGESERSKFSYVKFHF